MTRINFFKGVPISICYKRFSSKNFINNCICFSGEKNSFSDLNREISEAEAILSDQAEQIDDRRNVSPD